MPIKIDPDAYYKLEELKNIFNRSIPTLRRWCKNRDLDEARKIKKEWIVPGKSIIKFLSGKEGNEKKFIGVEEK